MLRALALLGAAVVEAYAITAGVVDLSAITTALLAFAGISILAIAALRRL